jgi:hypothetical protein
MPQKKINFIMRNFKRKIPDWRFLHRSVEVVCDESSFHLHCRKGLIAVPFTKFRTAVIRCWKIRIPDSSPRYSCNQRMQEAPFPSPSCAPENAGVSQKNTSETNGNNTCVMWSKILKHIKCYATRTKFSTFSQIRGLGSSLLRSCSHVWMPPLQLERFSLQFILGPIYYLRT